MINKRLIKPAVIITALTISLCACGKQAEPATTEPTETASEVETEESTEESLEPTPSPTATPEESVEGTEVEEISESEVDTTASEEVKEDLEYEIISIDDTVMYATSNCNIRAGAGTQYDKVGSLSYAQEVTINGKVEAGEDKLWYVIKTDDGSVQMVSASLLSINKPSAQTSNGGSTGNSGSSAQQPSGESSQPSGGNGQPSMSEEQAAIFDSIFGGHGNSGTNGPGAGGDSSRAGELGGINWQ